MTFVNDNGDFELPNYLFRVNTELMKNCLDFGTLLSEDPAKLRAFKEQVKKLFKKRWLDIAAALQFYDVIVPCGCRVTDFCEQCGGSRYKLNASLSPDEMRDVSLIMGAGDQVELADKLRKGLIRALEEVESY